MCDSGGRVQDEKYMDVPLSFLHCEPQGHFLSCKVWGNRSTREIDRLPSLKRLGCKVTEFGRMIGECAGDW